MKIVHTRIEMPQNLYGSGISEQKLLLLPPDTVSGFFKAELFLYSKLVEISFCVHKPVYLCKKTRAEGRSCRF